MGCLHHAPGFGSWRMPDARRGRGDHTGDVNDRGDQLARLLVLGR